MTKSKNAGLMVLTAALSLLLTHANANEKTSPRQDSPSPFGAEQKPDTGKDHDTSTDKAITSEVRSDFTNNNDFRDTDIDVKAVNGKVSLSGTVSTEAQRNMAIKKAKKIKGVKHVGADNLKVKY